MATTKAQILDDIAQLAGGTVSIFSNVGKNIREDIKSRTHEIAHRLDLVSREDFEHLETRIRELETRLKNLEGKKKKK